MPLLPPIRRWFRVSLRASMVLVLMVGGTAGWMAHTIRTQRAAIAAVRAVGTVTFDYEAQQIPGGSGYRTEPAAPLWLRRTLGDELFQSVVAVELFEPDSPAILAEVAKFDHLKYLKVTDASPDGLGYGSVRGLGRLETLEVMGAGVTDKALGEIASLRTLQTLRISHSAGADVGFARLAALPRVRELSLLANARLTDARIGQMLAGLPALRDLFLNSGRGPVAEAVWALARHHPDLERLEVGSLAELTDADLAAIGRLLQLRLLSLRSLPVTDDGLAHLVRLQHLNRLDLQGSRVTGAGLVHLAQLRQLYSLNLTETRLGADANLVLLAQLPDMLLLALDETGITDAGASTLAGSERLLMLGLDNNPAITNVTLRALVSARGLGVLGVVGTGVTPEGIQTLLAARPGLRVIHNNGSSLGPLDVLGGP